MASRTSHGRRAAAVPALAMNLTELPFDQYQRYRLVADLLRGALGERPVTVLEVGGGVQSRLLSFLPSAHIVMVDVELGAAAPSVQWVQADARGRLPFRDA